MLCRAVRQPTRRWQRPQECSQLPGRKPEGPAAQDASLTCPVPPASLPHCALRADRKLLLIVRHGQAVSNYLSELLGPDEWFKVEGTCQYDDKQGTIYNVFDAGGF